jgi:MinD-like ATPase involved in chromosome partitioning or flagellar assembly
MKIISCYSFKGGTGRTTSTANIATALAQLGKNVCAIDLDIEGPGLSVVLDVENLADICIQDYFMAEDPENFDIHSMIIDIKARKIERDEAGWESLEGNLYFIPARIGVEKSTIVDYGEDRIEKLLKMLFTRIEENKDLGVDYLLIDSASGYSDMSAVSMAVCDLILTFFRWSRQHLHGTIKIDQFFKHLIDIGLERDYEFVSNSVPFSLFKGERKEYFQTIMDYLERMVEKEIFAMLPENDEMKWNEKVIIFDEKPENQEIIDRFNDITQKIINKFEA